jgi:hypothetical protein
MANSRGLSFYENCWNEVSRIEFEFFELDLKFAAKGQEPDQLIWKVAKLDKRWNLTTLQVDGHCISGKL